ncbi:DUF6350 family protein [Phycicoccus duodecadis]|uniref:Uncharacterized protein n=1 Tax=Phycicoccus duodecadis TaxID=173053 RepID=A0A2N3YKH0_9MICO|nr:DUF6350 family protein [Phycicoccus duodecadis]PKW27353.1 hypothetical protein ATL31_2194 [Phycicoccus duodecadis]
MTVTDRLRATLPGGGTTGDGPSRWGPGWRRSGLLGLLTALLSSALMLVPVVVAWRQDPLAGSDAGSALDVGASLWLLASGAQLTAGAATVSLTPLLGLAVVVGLAWLGARESVVSVSTEGEHWARMLPRPLAAAVAAWWGGYALVVVVGWALAGTGPFPPQPWSMILPLVMVPGLALLLVLRAVGDDDPDALGPRLVPPLPDVLRRGVGAGLAGAWLLLGVGMLVVVGALVLAWPQVQAIAADLGARGSGAWVLDLGQLSVLPNLAVWVVSFLAGPGFSVVDGASVSWGGVEGGLLPMVPVLGAMPQPGGVPALVGVVAFLLVVAVGAWVGKRAVATVARLSRLRTKVLVAFSGCATTALALALVDGVAGGSLGQFRLADVGAPALELGLVLFAELFLGALVHVLRDAWRLRR